MSARIGFVEARSRLGAKQEAKLNAKAEKVEDNKKMFTLGKLTRTLSSKKPKRDAYGVGARVAFQAQLQERANTDACNKSGHLEPGHIYRPQDAQKKKRVEEWLDDLNQGDDDKQGGGNMLNTWSEAPKTEGFQGWFEIPAAEGCVISKPIAGISNRRHN